MNFVKKGVVANGCTTIVAVLFFVGIASELVGQNKTISRKVIGSDFRTKGDKNPYEFWTIPQAMIFWKDSLLATADDKGEFKIEINEKIEELEIRWIGMYTDRIRITNNCEYLEVLLLPDMIHDYVTAKREQRLIKKERAILPELYKKAFEQGIFRREQPCR